MSWSESLAIARRRGNRREGTSVQNSFNLDERRVEGIELNRISQRYRRQMALEQPDDTLPHSPAMRSVGGDEVPGYSFSLQVVGGSGVERLQLLF